MWIKSKLQGILTMTSQWNRRKKAKESLALRLASEFQPVMPCQFAQRPWFTHMPYTLYYAFNFAHCMHCVQCNAMQYMYALWQPPCNYIQCAIVDKIHSETTCSLNRGKNQPWDRKIFEKRGKLGFFFFLFKIRGSAEKSHAWKTVF